MAVFQGVSGLNSIRNVLDVEGLFDIEEVMEKVDNRLEGMADNGLIDVHKENAVSRDNTRF